MCGVPIPFIFSFIGDAKSVIQYKQTAYCVKSINFLLVDLDIPFLSNRSLCDFANGNDTFTERKDGYVYFRSRATEHSLNV